MYGLMYTKHDNLYTSVASKELGLLLQFKASGVICRSATNECDITEYCNGTSGEVCVCMYVYVNVYVYVCVCSVYMYVYVYVYMYAHMCVFICCVRVCACAYTCMCVYLCRCVCVVCVLCVYVHMYTYVRNVTCTVLLCIVSS